MEFSRRKFVSALGASAGGVALSAVSIDSAFAGTPAVAPESLRGHRPNVVILICDDLGYGDLGCFGSKLNTPNLDRMASEGLRFLHYNGGHPVCSASRGSLLTGRYAPRIGVKPVYHPEDTDGLPASEVTIAKMLQQHGYATSCVGKWHLGDKPGFLPTDHGFDSYFGVPYSVDMHPLALYRNESIIEEHTDPTLLTPRYTEEAVKFINSAGDKPFFLYLGFAYPHIPIHASPRFKGKSAQGIYGDAVEEIDWSAGEILGALQKKGIDEKTIVLFTSDHGPWYQGSPGITRGRKGTTFEGGFRVPMIARWKGKVPAGRTTNEWATHLDILPTVANLCGTPVPPNPLDGMDVSSILAGGRAPVHASPTLYFPSMHAGMDLQCARIDGWKVRFAQYTHEVYVLGSGNPGDNLMLRQPELYDLNNDPAESYDISEEHSEIVSQIITAVNAMMPKFPPRPAAVYAKLKDNVEQRQGPSGAAARGEKPDKEDGDRAVRPSSL